MPADDQPVPAARDATRRRLLTMLGGGGAALAVTQLPSGSAVAADGDALILGSVANQASSTTALNSGGDVGLTVNNNTGGVALNASSPNGIGATFSTATGQALVANGPCQFNGNGAFAISVDNPDGGGIQLHCGPTEDTPTIKANRFSTAPLDVGPAIVGVSSLPGSWSDGPNIGILGSSGTGEGLHGHSSSGIGIHGTCDFGVSVQGFTENGVAGWFFTEGGGIALRVGGIAEFDHVGFGAIPAGQGSGWVDNPNVTESSHITVTLTSDPGPRSVRWVEKTPGAGFRVHLTAAPGKNRPMTELTYLIVEPSSG